MTEAERERERWMTLAEAIAHIAKHDGCDRDSALKQLRGALGDRRLHNKWEDQRPNHACEGMIISPDWPPDDASSWQQADIQVDTGKVFDPSRRRWRTLLILKDSVSQIWGDPSVASAGSESGKARPITKAKGRGRPGACNKVHQAADRISQRGLSVKETPRKEFVAQVAEESGMSVRTVQKYFPSWLEKH
jgi:hypothetical protein